MLEASKLLAGGWLAVAVVLRLEEEVTAGGPNHLEFHFQSRS